MGLRHVSEVRDEAVPAGKELEVGIESWGGLVRVGSLAKEKGQILPLSRRESDAVSTYEIQKYVYKLAFTNSTQSANCKLRFRHSKAHQ